MQNPTNRGRISAMVRGVSIFAILVLVVLAYLYFHPLLALWLAALAVLTYFCPALAVAVLFVVISIDTARPTVSGIIISYSEFEFATVLFAWLTTVSDFHKLNLKPLLWGAPFLAAVAISGLANIAFYKIPFHVIRLSELMMAMFLAANVFRPETKAPFSAASIPAEFRWALTVAMLLHTVSGFSQFITIGTARIFSQFGNPNQFAGFLITLLPFFVTLWIDYSGRRVRLFWAYFSILCLTALLATLSRAALFAALVSSGILWVLYYQGQIGPFFKYPGRKFVAYVRKNARLVGAHFLALVTVALLICVLAPESLSPSFRIWSYRSQTGVFEALKMQRAPYFEIGARIWRSHPLLGVGPGRYDDVIRADQQKTPLQYEDSGKVTRYVRTHVHNLYLQLAVNFGLLGLLTFLYMFAKISFFHLRTYGDSVCSLAGLGVISGFLVHNLFDVTFPSLALELGLLLGVSVASVASVSGGRSEHERVSVGSGKPGTGRKLAISRS